jgi:hypothetical protein
MEHSRLFGCNQGNSHFYSTRSRPGVQPKPQCRIRYDSWDCGPPLCGAMGARLATCGLSPLERNLPAKPMQIGKPVAFSGLRDECEAIFQGCFDVCRCKIGRVKALSLSKKLTRRANHRHMSNIARISKPAPGTGRGLFESDGDRRHITFVPPQFRSPVYRAGLKEIAMKNLFVAVLIAGSFVSFEARAQGRAGDAALGAVSGAVVLGPVGAVAGAFIGYTAGPAIAHSWGAGRSASRPRTRHATQSSVGTQEPGVKEPGVKELAAKESGVQQQAAAKVNSSPPIKTPDTVASGKVAPPVQGFE